MFLNPSTAPGFTPFLGSSSGAGIDTTTLVGPLVAVLLDGNSWKVGDTLPILRARLDDANGAIDLTAASVVIHIRPEQDTVVLLSQSVTVNPNQTAHKGEISYPWATNDISRDGSMQYEFRITFADGRRATAPNQSFGNLNFEPAISN
jgi:hypothetical protein